MPDSSLYKIVPDHSSLSLSLCIGSFSIQYELVKWRARLPTRTEVYYILFNSFIVEEMYSLYIISIQCELYIELQRSSIGSFDQDFLSPFLVSILVSSVWCFILLSWVIEFYLCIHQMNRTRVWSLCRYLPHPQQPFIGHLHYYCCYLRISSMNFFMNSQWSLRW